MAEGGEQPTSTASCTSGSLGRKKNAKSVVWDYFGIRLEHGGLPIRGEEQKLICRSCGKVVLAKGGNTTNLLTHLKDHHPQLHVQPGKMWQASLTEVAFTTTDRLGASDKIQCEISSSKRSSGYIR